MGDENIDTVLNKNIAIEKKMLKLRIKYLYRLISRSKPRWELGTSRLLYFVGEVALKFLTYLEVVFTKEIKFALQSVNFYNFLFSIIKFFRFMKLD